MWFFSWGGVVMLHVASFLRNLFCVGYLVGDVRGVR